MKKAAAFLLIGCAGCELGGSSPSEGLPTELGLQVIASGLSDPLQYVANPARPTVAYVIERLGRVRLIEDDILSPTPVMQISSLLASGEQQGVLAMALDPKAAVNRRFYLAYTADPPTTVRVVRFTFSADFRTADPASATPILTILQAADSSHKAGSIHFDNDGMMRIAIGDGAGANDPANNAQNPLVLSGKILRIDPSTDGQPGDPDQHYTIPADNPFAGSSDVRPEIWAFGVRNPFRWTYDSASGASIIADVGQDAREELNFEPASRSGRNYGWPQREGAAATAHPGTPRPGPIQEPWFDWGRSDGRSVIGGFVYCGGDLGEFTRYLFGDFSLGVIRSVEVRTDSAGEALPAGISATKRHRTQDALNGLVAIKPDALGEPVIVEMFSGRVSRLVAE